MPGTKANEYMRNARVIVNGWVSNIIIRVCPIATKPANKNPLAIKANE